MVWPFTTKKAGFDEDARALAAERRKMNTEYENRRKELELAKMELEYELKMKKLEAEIAEYADEDEPDDIDGMFKTFITQSLNKRTVQGAAIVPHQTDISPPNPARVSISNEQFKEYWDSLGGIKQKIAKMMSDDQLKGLIVSKIPNIDDDSLNRAIFMVREDL